MSIAIVPHSETRKDLVETFNAALRAGGSPWGFYVDPVPAWIPKTSDDQTVWREFHLAVQDDERVVGAYGLKPQRWLVHGREQTVADWQGPVSLGTIDPKFSVLGLRMVRDMTKKYAQLYSWGHGGQDQPIVQLLEKMGWMMHATPFLFRVCRPKRFLREANHLRSTPQRVMALDLLAATGLGTIAIHALHGARQRWGGASVGATAEVVSTFGPWADAVWRESSPRYAAIACRDAETMNTLVPSEHRTAEWPEPTRLRIRRGERTLGWAVVVERTHEGDARFGNMSVGMIADMLATPEDSVEIVQTAYNYLQERGVDMVIANHSHPGWIRGFEDAGFVTVPNRRMFCASPELQKSLAPWEQTQLGLFLTNFDGHGPMM